MKIKKYKEVNENTDSDKIINDISSKWGNNSDKDVWVKGKFITYVNNDEYSEIVIPCINNPQREVTVVVRNSNTKNL